MTRIILGGCVLLVLGLVGWRVIGESSGESSDSSQKDKRAIAVRVAPIQRKTLRDVRTFTGSLRADSTFVVASKVGGRLQTVTAELGDPIQHGQLVAQLDDAEYRQQMEQAKAEFAVANARIEQCKTRLRLAEREFERAQDLRTKQISSEAEFDRIESEWKTTQAELKLLQAQAAEKEAALRAAEVRLGYTAMWAMWESGGKVRYVGARFVDEGEMLTPNTPILSIVDIETLQAVVHVIERDYPELKPGQKARVRTDAYPDEEFSGTVVRVSQVLQENSRQAEMQIAVPNVDLRLKPGMFVRVEIELASRADTLVVPRAAVVQYKEKTGVWQIDAAGGVAQFTAIDEGIRDPDWVEVRSPQIAGPVIVLGQHLLRDGSAVIVSTNASAGGKE